MQAPTLALATAPTAPSSPHAAHGSDPRPHERIRRRHFAPAQKDPQARSRPHALFLSSFSLSSLCSPISCSQKSTCSQKSPVRGHGNKRTTNGRSHVHTPGSHTAALPRSLPSAAQIGRHLAQLADHTRPRHVRLALGSPLAGKYALCSFPRGPMRPTQARLRRRKPAPVSAASPPPRRVVPPSCRRRPQPPSLVVVPRASREKRSPSESHE